MNILKIVHIYPKEMNIYGDNGNVLIIEQRLKWRGYKTEVVGVGVGDDFPDNTFMIIGGGGQDSGQSIIVDDLKKKSTKLKSLAKKGIPMLMICGMYQMFGHYFKTNTGEKLLGIGILDVYTVAGEKRVIGNIASDTEWGTLVGYENHSGLTYLGKNARSFGKTIINQGNNGKDFTEGAREHNVFGTYMHGPVLSKAPQFADYLITQAFKTLGQDVNLKPLDIDDLSYKAKEFALKRPR